jgi:hypothetical protein
MGAVAVCLRNWSGELLYGRLALSSRREISLVQWEYSIAVVCTMNRSKINKSPTLPLITRAFLHQILELFSLALRVLRVLVYCYQSHLIFAATLASQLQ